MLVEEILEEVLRLDDDELNTVVEVSRNEYTRRLIEKDAPFKMEEVAREYQNAMGILPTPNKVNEEALTEENIPVWIPPTSALDVYFVGATVRHRNRYWRSTTPANAHEPGVSGWRELPRTIDGESIYPDWLQPAGAHDAYVPGDKVMWNDTLYVCLISNVYTPGEYIDGWEEVVEVEEVEDGIISDLIYAWEEGSTYAYGEIVTHVDDGQFYQSLIPNNSHRPESEYWRRWIETLEPLPPYEDAPEEPEPEPEPVPEWVQPGGHNPYKIGDQVTFQGAVYESTINNNVWSPSAYPAGWKKIS